MLSILRTNSAKLIGKLMTRGLISRGCRPYAFRSQRASLGQNLLKFYSQTSTTGTVIPPEVANLPLTTYHNEANKFLDNLLENLETLSDDFPELLPEVEYSSGVMTLVVPKLGPYVINKQPPNKQIWLASPVSGPDRFDFYQNDWVSLRNNVKLLDVLGRELRTVLPEDQVNIRKENF
ncbi:ferroxidase KNAG_0A05470 [Huiozyma naganishii CBS 8797]|uniref:ferroxidase n=1 Tax=Huiozyma naganishii (strain ATCC MYA-139 / BCRC 22969 / CBS 8797 / KCTC 17520 / NBRC 10181 / NCYC 3082 / Yp74L-3) TaxID=1071383 RepID=J7RTV8_HUIN7|nr:hypothetical protein KNAG_0A05470 [Kazachstania naganishii CBS 8797]CCK68212.1 hypothetical protein KNAG_0A05470 [Kazachstania naganishii CBS 8797]